MLFQDAASFWMGSVMVGCAIGTGRPNSFTATISNVPRTADCRRAADQVFADHVDGNRHRAAADAHDLGDELDEFADMDGLVKFDAVRGRHHDALARVPRRRRRMPPCPSGSAHGRRTACRSDWPAPETPSRRTGFRRDGGLATPLNAFSCSGRLVIPSRLRNIYKRAPSKWLKKHSLAKKIRPNCKVCEGDAMKKTFMGVRLKRLREEQRLTQAPLPANSGSP